MGAGGGNQEGTPLVWNDTLYGITTWSVAFGGGLGRAANIVGPNNAKVDNAPMLFVFALGGTAALPAPPPASEPAPRPAAPEHQN